jgi:hypothetical protein
VEVASSLLFAAACAWAGTIGHAAAAQSNPATTFFIYSPSMPPTMSLLGGP